MSPSPLRYATWRPDERPRLKSARFSSSWLRRAGVAIGVTCLVAVVAAFGALELNGRMRSGGWLPPSAESVRADTRLAADFQVGAPDLTLLATTAGSVDDASVVAAASSLTRRIASDKRISWTHSYWRTREPGMRSADGHTALLAVRFRGDDLAVRRAATDAIDRFTGSSGPLRITAMGQVAVRAEIDRASDQDRTLAEAVAVPLVLPILLWALGSAVAAMLPILMGVAVVASAMGLLWFLSLFTTVSTFSVNITMTLGFALAVDYGLLVVNRYREELLRGITAEEAWERMMRGAGRTVLFSAAVIAVSLSGLLSFPLPFLRSLAYGGIAVVCMAAVGALTVLPALMIVLGPHLWKYDVFAFFRHKEKDAVSGSWYGLARWVMKRPSAVTVGVLVLLGLLAVPASQVRFGMYDERVLPASSQVVEASRQYHMQFKSEVTTPVLLDGLSSQHPAIEVDSYARRLASVPHVREVVTATGRYRGGQRVRTPDAQSFRFTGPTSTWLSVTHEASDPLTPESAALVAKIREVPAPVPALAGGAAAGLADTTRVLTQRLPVALGITLTGTLLLLMALTRSFLIPVKALLVNALGLAATAGVLVAGFQQGHLTSLWGGPPTGVTDVITPSLLFCVVFGLSMDYEVFLLSRIVEEHRQGSDTETAIAIGLQRSAPLFTAAALVFAMVMTCMAFSSLVLLQLVGTGLALAVLLDCTVIRALLVPAVMKLLGGANWWLPTLSARRSAKEP